MPSIVNLVESPWPGRSPLEGVCVCVVVGGDI